MKYKFIKLAFISLALGVSMGAAISSAMSTRTPDFGVGVSTGAELELTNSNVSQEIACEDPLDAWHAHGYANTTDPGTGSESYFVGHKFRIYFHDDFVDDVDFNTLECTVPTGGTESDGINDGLVPCDGGSSTTYGGVEIELISGDTSSDAEYPDYAEWTYGVNSSSGKPFIPGLNDYDGDGDTEDEGDDRDMNEVVYWVFEDGTSGSATTTAAIYVQFWSYDQSCGDYGDMSCWEEAEEDGSTDKHWNTHTNTATTTFECDEPTCQTLEITPDSSSISVDHLDGSAIDFNATVTNTDDDDITDESDINWLAFDYQTSQPDYTDSADANGDFRYGFRDLIGRSNDVTPSADKEVSYYNAESGDWILAKVEGSEEGICEAALQLPYCVDLSITDPIAVIPVSSPYSDDITINAEASTGEDWPYTIEWDSSASDATFDGVSPVVSTDQASGGWTVAYESAESGLIEVYATDDPANSCYDSLSYIVPSVDVCEDVQIFDPYFTDGSSFDETDADDVAALDGSETLCWNFQVDVPASVTYNPTLMVIAYTDNSASSLTGDALEVTVNETGTTTTGTGAVPIPLNFSLAQYTGSICWTGFEEGEYLYAEIAGEGSYCSDDYEFDYTPPTDDECVDEDGDGYDDETGERCEECIDNDGDGYDDDTGEYCDEPDTPGGNGGGGNGGGGGGDSDDDYVCEDVTIDPIREDEEICIDIDSTYPEHDLEIEFNGCDEGCIYYYDEDGNIIDENCGDDAYIKIETEDSQICGIVFSGICADGEIEIDLPDEDTDEPGVCTIEAEMPEAGELDKFIYTFNFSPEQGADEFYDTFFTHNADRAFYTVDYTPNGSETELQFTDDLWNDDIVSEEGGTLIMVRDANQLISDHEGSNDLDQGGNVYRYELLQRMGFKDANFRENADHIGDGIAAGNFQPVIPYITFDDGHKAIRIEDCVFSTDADGNKELQTKAICTEDLEYTLKEDSLVRMLNLDWLEEKFGDEIEDGDLHIRLRYVAVVDSGLNCEDETDPCLTEEFNNSAQVDLGYGITQEANALLASLCQYLVTRNAGDVFLEEQLSGGSDIACIYEGTEFDTADYRNVDALVIYDEGDDDDDKDSEEESRDYESITVGYTSEYAGLSISFCDDLESEEGGAINNLSSYVCEIVTTVADLWKSENIEETTSGQISQAVRNAETDQALLEGQSNVSWNTLTSALSNKNNPESGVLYYNGDGTDTLSLGSLTVEPGAWTLIVTDADVAINGNITYEESGSTDYTDLPSLAIIVEGGNIHVDNNVGEIHAFMVTDQMFTGDSRSEVDQQLVIYGSLYGNVQDLFDAAKYVGSPTTNTPGGGLVIYYDERIILNTPPYLSEKVDIYTEEAVN